jgi:hypothetical protein
MSKTQIKGAKVQERTGDLVHDDQFLRSKVEAKM